MAVILMFFLAFCSVAQAADKPSSDKPAAKKSATEKPAEKTAAAKQTPIPSVATEMSAAVAPLNKTEDAGEQVEPPVSAKILRYADRLIRRYDTNQDSKLQQNEWKAMRGNPLLADFDGDKIITIEEMARRIARYGYRRKIRLIPKTLEVETTSELPLLQPVTTAVADEKTTESATADKPGASAESTPSVTNQAPAKHDFRPGQRFYVAPRHRVQGLPGWFTNRDANGDQQLTMSEFASKATQSDHNEFARLDANGDGVITAKECAGKTPSATPAKPPSSTDDKKNGS